MSTVRSGTEYHCISLYLLTIIIDLDAGQLERKLRLLILSEIGFSRIGQNLHYSEIASALKIADSEVEKWSIDGACSTDADLGYRYQ